MSKTFSARARRWVGASVVAIAVAGLAGAGWAVEQAPAPAVLQPAALIQAPASNDVLSQGFANLVDAVKPAVVSVYVRAHGNPDETPGSDNGGGDNGNNGNDNGNNGSNGDSGGGGFQNLPPDSPLYHFFQQFGATPPKQIQHYEAAGSGGEGSFLACSFWLADAYIMLGRRDDAEALFDRLLGLRNDLGLLAEEYDARSGRQLGNFPQAYSHVALLNTARRLARPGKRQARSPTDQA